MMAFRMLEVFRTFGGKGSLLSFGAPRGALFLSVFIATNDLQELIMKSVFWSCGASAPEKGAKCTFVVADTQKRDGMSSE